MAKLNPKNKKQKKKRRQRPLVSDVNEPQHRKGKLEKRKSERDAGEMGSLTGRGTKTTDPKSLTFLGSMQQQEQKGGSCRFVMINRYA